MRKKGNKNCHQNKAWLDAFLNKALFARFRNAEKFLRGDRAVLGVGGQVSVP